MQRYDDVNVAYSSIHGFGLFAAEEINSGETIMLIDGEVISEEECIRRENDDNNVYIFWNGDNYIDTIKSEKIKFINHDCEPNCEVWDNDEKSLLLIASRDISVGEELTIDYGYDEIYEYCSCTACAV